MRQNVWMSTGPRLKSFLVSGDALNSRQPRGMSSAANSVQASVQMTRMLTNERSRCVFSPCNPPPYPPLTNNPFSSTNFFPLLLDGRDRDNLGLERAVKPGVPRIDLDQAVISNLRHHRVSTYSLPYNLKGKGAVFFFNSIQCFFLCVFPTNCHVFWKWLIFL